MKVRRKDLIMFIMFIHTYRWITSFRTSFVWVGNWMSIYLIPLRLILHHIIYHPNKSPMSDLNLHPRCIIFILWNILPTLLFSTLVWFLLVYNPTRTHLIREGPGESFIIFLKDEKGTSMGTRGSCSPLATGCGGLHLSLVVTRL